MRRNATECAGERIRRFRLVSRFAPAVYWVAAFICAVSFSIWSLQRL